MPATTHQVIRESISPLYLTYEAGTTNVAWWNNVAVVDMTEGVDMEGFINLPQD